MGMTIDNLCDSYTNIGCEFQSGIVRTKCAFYMPPHIEPDNCGNYVVMHPSKEGLKDTSEKELAIIEEEYISKADYNTRLKADMVAMLKELKYDLYHELCKEIHGKENCPCTNQTTSCLATFRVCDANRAIDKVIQHKINALKAESEG